MSGGRRDDPAEGGELSERRREDIWTLPNVLSGLRLVGIVPLLWLAWDDHRALFVGLLLVLLLSDWVDGKLAIWLDQRTELGARLDSGTDALLYGAVALSFWWLAPEIVLAHRAWLLGLLGTWILSSGVGLVRFGRLPSYHTRAAKLGWLVTGIVTLYTVWTGDGAGVPWALALVILTNVEAIAVGLVLPEWRADVPSVWHAVRIRRRTE